MVASGTVELDVGQYVELTGEADAAVSGAAACSGDEAGGFRHRRARIALDAAPYLARQLSQGRNRGKHVVRVSVRVRGLWWLGWT
jgi:predicted anti-sigma-YlaC factor YlaD